MFRPVSLFVLVMLSACANRLEVPTEVLQPDRFPAISAVERPQEYQIGPLDNLTVKVFQEPDLSIEEVPVDASGHLAMPLIGSVLAEGLTVRELSELIARRYDRYLVNPQVAVLVNKSANLNVTVDGQVRKPGVFPLEAGRTSLLQAVAMAEGTSEVAALNDVFVLRHMNGERYGARFDLRAIQAGAQPNPEIFAGDVVVVGTSSARGLYRDLLQTAPLLGPLFVVLAQ